MLDVVSGYDPDDPVTARGEGRVPEAGYVSHLDERGLEGARIGVVRQLFGLQDEASAPDAAAETVTAAVESAIDEMEAAGATIVDPVEVADTGFLKSARVLQYEFERDVDRYLDGLGDDAPCGSLAEIVASGEVAPSIESRITDGEILDVDVDGLDQNLGYLRRLDRRRQLAVDTERRMVERDLDALLYPPSTIPPVEIPDHQPFEELNCELAAHTGFPSIVVPAGFADDGLPVGVELLGRPFAEPRLFELAYAYEQATEHRRPPEGFGAIR
jgi:Asp-tRNA(Asn)/Glu-tRNA(Gln) amidotransferase A subunit family amidase